MLELLIVMVAAAALAIWRGAAMYRYASRREIYENQSFWRHTDGASDELGATPYI
jgi:hypothetical protein